LLVLGALLIHGVRSMRDHWPPLRAVPRSPAADVSCHRYPPSRGCRVSRATRLRTPRSWFHGAKTLLSRPAVPVLVTTRLTAVKSRPGVLWIHAAVTNNRRPPHRWRLLERGDSQRDLAVWGAVVTGPGGVCLDVRCGPSIRSLPPPSDDCMATFEWMRGERRG